MTLEDPHLQCPWDSASAMDRFISMGEKLGMSGKELKDWVTEEMNKERDERGTQRANEWITAEVEIAKANKEVEIAEG